MKEYSYVASKKDGTQIKGVRKAESPNQIVEYLHENNLVVGSIQENIGLDFKRLAEIQIGGLPLKEKMILTKQLSTMIGAGVPLVQSLDVLISQTKNKAVKGDLMKVFEGVQGGSTLSQAFSKNSNVYDELQISLLEAGEKSGNMVEVLQQITIDLEKRNQLVAKIRGAMIYPVIIFVVIIVVVIVMMVFMIPAVKNLYDDFGVDSLPWITQMFVDISDAVTNPIGASIGILSALALVIGGKMYYSSPSGRRSIDKLLLKVPVFGVLFEYSQVVQMTRLLAMLVKSGLSIVDSLTTVSKAMGNIHYKDALDQAVIDVSKGSPIAVSLAKSEVIPVIVIKMIAIGEETGTVDKMLLDMSKFYEEELNNLADNLTKLMEPIILLVVGVIVAILAIAIYLPIYQISSF